MSPSPNAGFSVSDGLGLVMGGLRRLGGMDVLDRYGLRDRVEGMVYSGAKNGFGAANTAARTFAKATSGGSKAERQTPRAPRTDLFDLTPDDEQQMLVDTFADFAENYLRPAAREADDAQAVPTKLAQMATEMGAMVLGIPEALGGVVEERSAVTSVLAMEALAHGDMGLAAGIMAPAAVATLLSLHGTAAQQATYLEPFTGDEPPAAALAIAEPHVLADPAALRTTATPVAGGGWTLSGTKALVARVADAELFVVAAATPDGPALFIVPATTEGLLVRPEPTMGTRATGSGELQLDGVSVDADALVGGEVSAEVYDDVVARSRIAWAALAVGTSQAVLDYLIPYVKDRHAFGEPIAHRQAVAFKISDIAIELEGMRLATYRAASLADQGKPFIQAAAIARQLVTDKALEIGSDGVQLLGGHGYVKEHPVERWYRDLRGAGMVDGLVLV